MAKAASEEWQMNQRILLRVHGLMVEEGALSAGAPAAAATARLLEIESELDRCWELLSHETARNDGTAPEEEQSG
jgi:hypothetical protein